MCSLGKYPKWYTGKPERELSKGIYNVNQITDIHADTLNKSKLKLF